MGDKYLSELNWKTLCVKQKLKDDKGLTKALAALAKLGDTDPGKRLETLDEAAAAAEKLLKDKAVAAVEALADYLKLLKKDVADTRKLAEAAKAAADKKKPEEKPPAKGEDEGGESDEEEESGDAKTALVNCIAKLKSGEGKLSLQFAACPANPVWGILIGKRVGTPQKTALKTQFKSTTVHAGEVRWQEGALTFVVEKVKSGMAGLLQKAIKAVLGKGPKVRVVDAEGGMDGADEESGAAPGSGGPVKPELVAALAAWKTARGVAIGQLKALASAIAASGDPETKDAIILVQAIIKNLTEEPKTAQAVAELDRYVRTDDILVEAEEPNPFGVAVSFRNLLLNALEPLRAALAA